ncbi:MAG: type II toxin-antitoxin system VapC family toxin [Parafannyhessea sp.]|uniref:type II toxin-antitoxin system VapC family toxin n=1 Tax=Parafannyhessea sp. TaxID=2847324 RepID=UPI003F0AC6C7
MRILLDTNALLDLFSNRSPERSTSMRAIMGCLSERSDQALVCSTSLVDASYVIENNKAFKAVFPSAEQRRSLARWMRGEVLETCEIAAVDGLVCSRAQQNSAEPDYDDAVVAECALVNKCDCIVSSDISAFNNSQVPKLSPSQCARLLARRNTR